MHGKLASKAIDHPNKVKGAVTAVSWTASIQLPDNVEYNAVKDTAVDV